MSRTLIDSFVRHLAALVRGPRNLREDIYDEIADHLASRIEEETAHAGSHHDPAAIEAEAVRAFGDPQRIARELRVIHMGDWIMFQKVMIAALVVIVIGMAASTYFSWSAARQQNRQLDAMNKQLASLVELQETAPQRALAAAAEREAASRKEEQEQLRAKMDRAVTPQVKAYFYLGDKSKPAVDYTVNIWRNLAERESAKTDSKGLIVLPTGQHEISGAILRSDGGKYEDDARWSRVVTVSGKAPEETLEIDVSPKSECRFELDLSAVTWDREIHRRIEVSVAGAPGRSFTSRELGRAPVPDKTFTRSFGLDWPQSIAKSVAGLYPGKATATVSFYANPEDINRRVPAEEHEPKNWSERPVLTCTVPIEIAEGGGTIQLRLAPTPDGKIAGVIFEGSREHPVASQPAAVVSYVETPPKGGPGLHQALESVVTEHLKTTSKGEFVQLVQLGPDKPSGVLGFSATVSPLLELPWHTADSRKAEFVWPYELLQSYRLTNDGTFYEVDMAKLGTVRLSITGVEELLAAGYSLREPLRVERVISIPTRLGRPSGSYFTINDIRFDENDRKLDPLTRRVDLSTTRSTDLLMFEREAGKYGMLVRFVTAKPKEDAPDLIALTTYSRAMSFEVNAGKVTELQVAVDKLEQWQASQPQWQRIAATTQPRS